MEILHVITGLGLGGAEGVLYRLIGADDPRRHQVLALGDSEPYGARLRALGVKVWGLGLPSVAWHRLPQILRQVRAALRPRPRLIQTWLYHADLVGGSLGRAYGIPVVWNLRHVPFPADSKIARLGRWHRACASWLPTGIIACGETVRRAHEQLGYRPARWWVIPNGCDVERFQPDPRLREVVRARLALPPDLPILGMIGRWDPQKDLPTLLSALNALRWHGVPFRLVLAGQGMDPGNAELRALLLHMGVDDCTLALGSYPDLPGLYNALDLLILPSAYGEGCPNVLLEAMACGVPAVATTIGETPEILGPTGWTVPPRDPAALATTLLAALIAWRDQVAWEARRQAARQRICERFTLDQMLHRYRTLWESVCAA